MTIYKGNRILCVLGLALSTCPIKYNHYQVITTIKYNHQPISGLKWHVIKPCHQTIIEEGLGRSPGAQVLTRQRQLLIGANYCAWGVCLEKANLGNTYSFTGTTVRGPSAGTLTAGKRHDGGQEGCWNTWSLVTDWRTLYSLAVIFGNALLAI